MLLALLIEGDENEYVLLLQRFLVLNGLLHRNPAGEDPVNGKFDAATKAAVKAFQRSAGLPDVDGQAGGMTWAKIAGVPGALAVVDDPKNLPSLNLPSLKSGDRGSLVTVLQKLLLLYQEPFNGTRFVNPGILTQNDLTAASGQFGDKTKQAVADFQKNLAVKEINGEVGRETWDKLLFPRGRTNNPPIQAPTQG